MLICMELTTAFRSYYKRVLAQIVSECKKHVVPTIFAALIAFGAAYLQVQYFSFPETQTWLRAATTVAVTVFVFLLYVLYYAVRAPWHLHNEAARGHASSLAECRTASGKEIRDLTEEHDTAVGVVERENAALRDQLGNPKLECHIDEYDIQEVVSPDIIRGGGLFSEVRTLAGISDMDTIVTVVVTIANAHRTPTTAKCDLKIRDRSHQEHSGTQQVIPERLNHNPLDLGTPIKYALPRSGALRFRFANKSREQLAAGRLILVVTDGVNQVSTDERQL